MRTMSQPVRIDAHQHFWRLANSWTNWPTHAEAKIFQDYAPADLQPILTQYGIEKTILVQAAPSVEETADLLRIASETPFVAGIVGWVDFEHPEIALRDLDELSDADLFKGVRPMLQSIEETEWILAPKFQPIFEKLEQLGMAFDALIQPRHLPTLARLADRHPNLHFIIDHCAKPAIEEDDLSAWRHHLGQCAQRDNISCKLSGLVTEAQTSATLDMIMGVFEHSFNSFGAERLLWGSDWPVVNMAPKHSYETWRDMTEHMLAKLSPDEQDNVLGLSAARIYHI